MVLIFTLCTYTVSQFYIFYSIKVVINPYNSFEKNHATLSKFVKVSEFALFQHRVCVVRTSFDDIQIMMARYLYGHIMLWCKETLLQSLSNEDTFCTKVLYLYEDVTIFKYHITLI